jgi:hypothetical protein
MNNQQHGEEAQERWRGISIAFIQCAASNRVGAHLVCAHSKRSPSNYHYQSSLTAATYDL